MVRVWTQKLLEFITSGRPWYLFGLLESFHEFRKRVDSICSCGLFFLHLQIGSQQFSVNEECSCKRVCIPIVSLTMTIFSVLPRMSLLWCHKGFSLSSNLCCFGPSDDDPVSGTTDSNIQRGETATFDVIRDDRLWMYVYIYTYKMGGEGRGGKITEKKAWDGIYRRHLDIFYGAIIWCYKSQ